MPTYVTGFVATDISEVYFQLAAWGQAIRRLKRTNPILGRQLEREARDIARRFTADLRRIERQTSVRVTRGMRTRAKQARVRPSTGSRDRLASALIAEPLEYDLPSGSIGIANVDILDKKVINPRGRQYGPYWRSQEYGYKPRGKQLTGIYGGFFGASGRGKGSRPSHSEFRKHPIFIPDRQGVGKLVVGKETRAKRFIRDTALIEGAIWKKNMDKAQADTIERVRVVMGFARARPRRFP